MTAWDPDAELTDGQELVRLADGAQSLLSKYEEFLEGDFDSIPNSELQKHNPKHPTQIPRQLSLFTAT